MTSQAAVETLVAIAAILATLTEQLAEAERRLTRTEPTP
jgi:hypothetical protein